MNTYRADIGAANDNRQRKKRRFWLIVLTVFLSLVLLAYVQGRRYLFDGLPALPDKQAMWASHIKPNYTLLDKDGNVLSHRGPYYGRPLKTEEMPAFVPDAFLAIEDQRFWQHKGIDRKAIFRALLANTKAGKKVQGGSTLTQQLVKNMVLSREKTYKRKFQEMWLAYKMEKLLSKKEILELYLNRIDLGNRSYGIGAAAKRLFGKNVKDLNLSEAAILAALPKAPGAYDPVKHPQAAQARAHLVLRAMLDQGKITLEQMRQAEKNLSKSIELPNSYMDENLIGHVFDMAVEKSAELIGSAKKDLIIRTTIDPKLQKLAFDTIETVIDKNQKSKKISQGALISIDIDNGAIRALIGGRDYRTSKFNRVSQAKRQPGSAFKPFVYAAALEFGHSPGTVRIDQPTTIGFGDDAWTPQNYTREYSGPMTLREALKLSINTIAAQLGAEVGPDKVAELARRFGISTDLRINYSLALGSSEVYLQDMASAYMVFANEGLKRPAYLIESIEDTAGNNLYSKRHYPPIRVYAKTYARQMTGMLKDVIDSGSGRGAKLGRRQSAGKTGTSQDYRDAWFIGFTAQYVTGIWLGNDDNSPMNKITGGLLPVDAWKSFMKAAHKGLEYLPLKAPDMDNIGDKKIMVFYANLRDQLLAERDLANGKTGKKVKKPQ